MAATDVSAGGLDTPALWISVVIFAHLFASFFLYRVWMLTHPKGSCSDEPQLSAADESDAKPTNTITTTAGIIEPQEVVLSISSDPPQARNGGTSKAAEDESDADPPRASLAWENLGCSYLTASGPRAVLKVGVACRKGRKLGDLHETRKYG